MQLCELEPGTVARINGICMKNHKLHQRLIDLGIVENVDIQLLAKAPFCGPVAMHVKNQSISIRHCDAACIYVDMI